MTDVGGQMRRRPVKCRTREYEDPRGRPNYGCVQGFGFESDCIHACDLSDFCSAALPGAISDQQSLRATGLQSMKWLTEYLSARAMIVSLFNSRWMLSAARHLFVRGHRDRVDLEPDAYFAGVQKPFHRVTISTWR
jgi:hypothetical protein